MDLIMGMNSGSSFDGIDVILAETEMAEDGFPKAPRFICGGSYEWPKEVADIVQNAFVNKVDMVGLNRLNYLCGAVFAEKAAQFMRENKIDSKEIKVLGLDTQTIYQEQPNHAAITNMTIEENLALAYSRSRRGSLGMAVKKSEKEIFKSALAEFGMGLEDRMKTKVGLLSGGQRQVVTLLMCTIVTPKLLLLDEHTAALDPATAEKVMEITNKIVKRNELTTLMITHNMNSALKTGNRTIMMDSGEIILDVSGEEREKMTLDDLLNMYSLKKKEEFANDRMLLG